MTRERLTPSQRVDWLRLIRTENVRPQTFRQLINRFGSAGEALRALLDLVRRSSGAAPSIPGTAEIEDEIALADRIGARFIAKANPTTRHTSSTSLARHPSSPSWAATSLPPQ